MNKRRNWVSDLVSISDLQSKSYLINICCLCTQFLFVYDLFHSNDTLHSWGDAARPIKLCGNVSLRGENPLVRAWIQNCDSLA